MIEQIWKVIPLPLWGKIAILVILVMLIILLVKRLLKFKSISFGFSGPAVTFEKKKTEKPGSSGIDQTVTAEEGGKINSDIEQDAEGDNISQSVSAKGGKIEGKIRQKGKS